MPFSTSETLKTSNLSQTEMTHIKPQANRQTRQNQTNKDRRGKQVKLLAESADKVGFNSRADNNNE